MYGEVLSISKMKILKQSGGCLDYHFKMDAAGTGHVHNSSPSIKQSRVDVNSRHVVYKTVKVQ